MYMYYCAWECPASISFKCSFKLTLFIPDFVSTFLQRCGTKPGMKAWVQGIMPSFCPIEACSKRNKKRGPLPYSKFFKRGQKLTAKSFWRGGVGGGGGITSLVPKSLTLFMACTVTFCIAV